MKRREFIKTTALAGLGAGLAACTPGRDGSSALRGGDKSSATGPYDMSRIGGNARMHLSFFPYELQLQHTFTVAS